MEQEPIENMLENMRLRALEAFAEKHPGKPEPMKVIVIGAGVGESVHRVLAITAQFHAQGIAVCIPTEEEMAIINKRIAVVEQPPFSFDKVDLPKLIIRHSQNYEGDLDKYFSDHIIKPVHKEKFVKQKYNTHSKKYNSKGFR